MRAIGLLIAVVTIGAFVTPSAAAQAPTFARCEALSIQRGAGPEGPGLRAHRQFMADCMAGKITELARVAKNTSKREAARTTSYEKCEQLSEQRGAGPEGPGQRSHNNFMTQCMAGKIR